MDRAIEIARRAGLPLRIAAKVDSADKDYLTLTLLRGLMRRAWNSSARLAKAEKLKVSWVAPAPCSFLRIPSWP